MLYMYICQRPVTKTVARIKYEAEVKVRPSNYIYSGASVQVTGYNTYTQMFIAIGDEPDAVYIA